MHDVFISYSKYDRSVADAICHHLESKSMRCWYAPRDIAPGKDWAAAIEDAIKRACFYIGFFEKLQCVKARAPRNLFGNQCRMCGDSVPN